MIKKKHFILSIVLLLTSQFLLAAPKSHHYTNAFATMQIIALNDDMIHVEYKSGKHPAKNTISVTPFVQKTDFDGPSVYHVLPNGFQTKKLKAVVYQQSLCIRLYDLTEKTNLTKICPHGLDRHVKSIRLDPSGLTNAYGLGQQFTTPGVIDGDWTTHKKRRSGPFGNVMEKFDGASASNTQIPVLYGLGKQNKNFALYVDNEFKQDWFFSKKVWRGQIHGGSAVRFFFMTGTSIKELRSSYLALTGNPPVPPKKMFGLWLSENGFDNWQELDAKKSELLSQDFPFDGFVMDKQWFGGVADNSTATSMGKFAWNPSAFPKASEKIKSLAGENLGLIVIEEPYVGLDLYRQQKNFHKYMVKDKQGKPVLIDYEPWWGIGSMLDLTNPKVSSAWFDWKRTPLIKAGILGFWTNLGEPQQYIEDIAHYHDDKSHDQVHNLYNFLWNQSIYDGYQRNGSVQRPFMLSRSGGPGSQRLGVAMRSGDIAARATSLAAHYNAQMHMSLSGIDYYGSDIGGYVRSVGPDQDSDEYKKLYTMWLANAVWTDIPIRPHALNPKNVYETSPASVGMSDTNKENLMIRYQLLPYYYSLAHQAYQNGTSIVSPMVYEYQSDFSLRQLGSQKMIGPWIMIAHMVDPSTNQVSVHLPKGEWMDFYSKSWIEKAGANTNTVITIEKKSDLKLPAYVREGAIIPTYTYPSKRDSRIHVDSANAVEWMILPSKTKSSFVMVDDDGTTVGYQKGKLTSVNVSQVVQANKITIILNPTQKGYQAKARAQHLRLYMKGIKNYRQVSLNGKPLDRKTLKFSGSDQAWIDLSQNSIDTKLTVEMIKEK